MQSLGGIPTNGILIVREISFFAISTRCLSMLTADSKLTPA
jgi:hypothetical protein